jgi:hypothetical protein
MIEIEVEVKIGSWAPPSDAVKKINELVEDLKKYKIEIDTESDDVCRLIITTPEDIIKTPNLVGPEGPQGVSGVYVGSGDMPDGYNVQIDPNGEASAISASDISYTPADTSVIDMPNVQIALDEIISAMVEIVTEYTTVEKVKELIDEKLGVIENGYY